MGVHCVVVWDNQDYQSTKVYDLADVLLDSWYCRRVSYNSGDVALRMYFDVLKNDIVFDVNDYDDNFKVIGTTSYSLTKDTKIFSFEAGTYTVGPIGDYLEKYANSHGLNYVITSSGKEIMENISRYRERHPLSVKEWYEKNKTTVEVEYETLEKLLIHLHAEYKMPVVLDALMGDSAETAFNDYMLKKYPEICKLLNWEERVYGIECDGLRIEITGGDPREEMPRYRYDPAKEVWYMWDTHAEFLGQERVIFQP